MDAERVFTTSNYFKTSDVTKRYNITTKLRRNTEQQDQSYACLWHIGFLSHKIILYFRGFFEICHQPVIIKKDTLFTLIGMQTWQFLYFLFNVYIKFKNRTFWSFYLYGRFKTRRFETRRFETWRFETWRFVNLKFWNLTFCSCTKLTFEKWENLCACWVCGTDTNAKGAHQFLTRLLSVCISSWLVCSVCT